MSGLTEIAARWVQDSMPALEGQSFAQADIDELLGNGPPHAAAEAIAMLKELIAATPAPIVPVLVLPLPASHRLLTRPPNIERLLAGKWVQLEVPGFYLTKPHVWSMWEQVEQYLCPIVSSAPGLAGLEVQYRVWRAPQERSRGWEYHRAMYIRGQSGDAGVARAPENWTGGGL